MNDIFVYAGWDDDRVIGVIHRDIASGEEVVSFEYDPAWLKCYPNLILDPTLPQAPYRTYSADKALFGAFQDSCPDRWGRKLIDRRESVQAMKENRRPKKFFDSEYLLEVQDFCRSGGFRFKTDSQEEFLKNDTDLPVPPISSVRELEQISLGYESDRDSRWISQLVAPGSSLGGARPKANVLDTDGSLWIAKFPSRYDDYDIGAWEKVTHDLARKCGIKVPESKLVRYSDLGSTFLVKRFDRDGKGKRIHFASAMTMLGLRDGKTDGTGFLDLAEIIEQITIHAADNLHQLFRRMIFDIAISNQDDHLRNHGFLLLDGKWELSPAYDMNPVHNADYLAMNIDLNDGYRSFDKAIDTCMFYQLSRQEAESIVKQVSETVSDSWPGLAAGYGIRREEQRRMSSAFALTQS